MIDVLVVGGGPAGLSAALILGRSHRTVLVCDGGNPRNRSSQAIHALLGREGLPPAAFLEQGRRDLEQYKSVSVRETQVMWVVPTEDCFAFACADGTAGKAFKVLLATGLTDELPDLPGVHELYGSSVHHCLYCDGFEYSGKKVAAYGSGDKGADLAIMMKHWFADVVLCSNGTELSESAAAKLKRRGVAVRSERIRSLSAEASKLKGIVFVDGENLERDAIFFSTGCHQASDLSERLGCQRDKKGGVITDPDTEESSVPGVYVAGDVSRDVLLVSIAIGEGAKAGVAINRSLLRRDGFCE
ncbi:MULTISPECIES: NAD(P)/FAD-dependent oxidoreductase [unclassified Afipia]|uniref:NAD(P)/FAD-dependent oxidoreductase n=1 Tax=unclassified Afipia TaxID=2642050 RepID=UPI000464CB51|nr:MULTISPECIES: NAD(P)/FAD-dependent oxidoreductase [unclassified Afipia]